MASTHESTFTDAKKPTVTLSPLASATTSVGRPEENKSNLPDAVGYAPDGALVRSGGDRAGGSFYCGNTQWVIQQQGTLPGTSLLKNARGELMAGFLHMPADRWTETDTKDYTQAERHASTRQVVGCAIRGYAMEAARQTPANEPIRLLLTGYGAFESITNNPTGDFVSHPENLDATMKAAFGSDLLTPSGTKVSGGGNDMVYSYQVRDPQTGGTRSVLLHAKRMEVADKAIDPKSPDSIETAIRTFRPQAVLALGVNPNLGVSDGYVAESRAHNQGLRVGKDGRVTHDDNAPETARLVNYSLSRAIYAGGGELALAQRPQGPGNAQGTALASLQLPAVVRKG